jgi:hypothetical protein
MIDVISMKTMKPVAPVWYDRDRSRKSGLLDRHDARGAASRRISSMSASRPTPGTAESGVNARPLAAVPRGQIGENERLIVEGEDTDSDFEVEEPDIGME